MQISKFIYLLLSICLVIACEKSDLMSENSAPQSSPFEVSIRASRASISRTELMPNSGNEQPVKWSEGDRIAVWAKSTTASTSNYTLDKVEFWLRTYNHSYDDADFVSKLPSAMNPNERYNYYAIYPTPASQSIDPQKPTSRYVSFNLPAEQNGAYNPNLDVMVASTEGRALAERGDYPNNLGPELEPTLQFRHLFHLVRIRIPESANNLGHPVKKLKITFPQNVVGNVSFDVTNVESTLSLTNAKNEVTINLDGDIDAGRGYVWLHIMPTELNGDVTIAAYSDSGVKSKDKTFHIERNLQAGHITPISFTVPRPYRPIVNISLNELTSHLGEPWNKMTLTGFNFVNLTTMEEMSSVTITPDNKFIAIYPDVNADNVPDMSSVNDKTLNVTYDSEHALLTDKTIALPSNLQPTSEYNTQANNTVNYEVPYLFEENFDNLMVNGEKVTEYEYFDLTNDNGAAQNVVNAIDLDRIGLIGWTGAKWWFKNNYLIVGSYIGSSWAGTDTNCKNGRVDTARLALKDKNTEISVYFKIKGYTSADNANITCSFGTTKSTAGKINGTSSWKKPTLPESDIKEIKFTNKSEGDYLEKIYTKISNCNYTTRLSWCSNPSDVNDSAIAWECVTDKQFYIHIDDIKVSIGSEVK